MEYDAFISYSSADMDVARKVYAYLQQKGLKPWMAPQCIPAGEPYARAIINGISKCRLMVVILSKTSNSSDDVLNEVDQAHHEKKVVLPFFIDETAMSGEMRYYLSRKQWINAYPEVTTAHCEQLFRAIKAYLPIREEEPIIAVHKARMPDVIRAFLPIREEEQQEIEESQKGQQKIKSDETLSGRYTVIAETPRRNYTLIVDERARDCGRSMMEKFPEMDLVPTSLYDWKKPKRSRVLSVIFFSVSILPLFIGVGFFMGGRNDGAEVSFTCALFCLLLGYLFFARYPKKGSPTLSSLADYIQQYRYKRKTRLGKKPQFVFFAKDSLFGVMNVADYKVQIPAEYERMDWKVKDSIISVTKGGHDFFIDINGERLY